MQKKNKDYYFKVENPKGTFIHVESRGKTMMECYSRLLFCNFENFAEAKERWKYMSTPEKRFYLDERFGGRITLSNKDKFNEYIKTED